MFPGVGLGTLSHSLRRGEGVVTRDEDQQDAGPCPVPTRKDCCRGAERPASGAPPSADFASAEASVASAAEPSRPERPRQLRRGRPRPVPPQREPVQASDPAWSGSRCRRAAGLGGRRGRLRSRLRRGRCRSSGLQRAVCFDRRAQLARHRRFDGGRRALDELTEFFELCKCDLAVDAEFGGDLVYAWFTSHNSPV